MAMLKMQQTLRQTCKLLQPTASGMCESALWPRAAAPHQLTSLLSLLHPREVQGEPAALLWRSGRDGTPACELRLYDACANHGNAHCCSFCPATEARAAYVSTGTSQVAFATSGPAAAAPDAAKPAPSADVQERPLQAGQKPQHSGRNEFHRAEKKRLQIKVGSRTFHVERH